MLPCSCNPNRARKDVGSGESSCENDVTWHLNFLQSAIQSAGGQATVAGDVPAIEVRSNFFVFALPLVMKMVNGSRVVCLDVWG